MKQGNEALNASLFTFHERLTLHGFIAPVFISAFIASAVLF
jgi:hypothetical protein